MLNDDVFVDILQSHQMLKQLLIIYKATNTKTKNSFFFIKILFLLTPINRSICDVNCRPNHLAVSFGIVLRLASSVTFG